MAKRKNPAAAVVAIDGPSSATLGKRKPGRPPIGKSARSIRVMIRITPEQWEKWSLAARRDSRTLADWMRLQCEKSAAEW